MVLARININPGTKTGEFSQSWHKTFGVGSAFLLLRKDLLSHVDDVHDTIGFEYLRFHGILSDDVGLVQYADKNGEEMDEDCLNFTNVDAIYDELRDMNIKPFVEFSFMPKYLAGGETQVFKYPSNVTPPRSFSQWQSLLSLLVTHWKERYGIDELRDWYFEIWNEPNLINFWTGTQAEYFSLYKYSAEAIKAIDHQLKVGGPASSDGKWITPFLKFCNDESVPVDFVSTHVYQSDKPLGGTGFVSGNYISDLVARVRAEIEASAFPALELHFTEWGSTSSPNDLMHDTSNQAAFICDAIASVNDQVTSFSYWVVSDIFEELGLPDTEFHGGFGIETVHGVRKPSFNAFYFLKQLGKDICEVQLEDLPEGIKILATRTSNDVRLLAWYFKDPKVKIVPEPITITLRVEKAGVLANQDLDFSILEISKEHGNPYEAWKKMESPRNPTPDQIEDLKQFGEIDEEEENERGNATQDDEQLTVDFELGPESVKYIRIYKG